jgi:hypothetical protein
VDLMFCIKTFLSIREYMAIPIFELHLDVKKILYSERYSVAHV